MAKLNPSKRGKRDKNKRILYTMKKKKKKESLNEKNSNPKEVTRSFYSPEMQAEITIIGETKRDVNSVSVGVVDVDENTGKKYYDIHTPTGWIDIYAGSSTGDCPGDISFESNKKARTAGIENAEDVISYASNNGISYTDAFNMFSKTKYERILVVMWQDPSTGMHGTYIFGKTKEASP